MKILVYSHDAFGLGNIRRMLAICQHLLDTIPDLSVLVMSGSPVLHSLRLPQGLDYIKLPCVGRDEEGELGVKFLNTEVDETLKLRSDLILTAAVNFKPDLLLVDKKPSGLNGELNSTLRYVKTALPQTKLVLLLRDILDVPEVTIASWTKNRYYEIVERLFDQVWVVGSPEVFDVSREYHFPSEVSQKVRYCGYVRKSGSLRNHHFWRQQLHVGSEESLILVTPGGGADGYRLVKIYLDGIQCQGLPQRKSSVSTVVKSIVVTGPDMPANLRREIMNQAIALPQIQVQEFTDDLMGYMDAADVVVSMGGYNTLCEILSLAKRAVVVPRVKPVLEQWMRAERLARLGLIQAIHPDSLEPKKLMEAIAQQLNRPPLPANSLDLDALPRIQQYVLDLWEGDKLQPSHPLAPQWGSVPALLPVFN